jgi:hypothetical protein
MFFFFPERARRLAEILESPKYVGLKDFVDATKHSYLAEQAISAKHKGKSISLMFLFKKFILLLSLANEKKGHLYRFC